MGHAYSALVAYHAAQAVGGRFLLRIEDIDQGRCKPEFEDAIYEDLNWLGLKWEMPVRRQSDHFDDYASALEQLREADLVYRCFKTRKEIAEEIARAPHLGRTGPEGVPYFGAPLTVLEERALLAKGAPFSWRLSISAAKEVLGDRFEALTFNETGAGPNGEAGLIKAKPDIFGDVVIARKDFGTSYHLSAVYDDALQDVTHIIRGEDLYHASYLHVLLQALLNLPTPIYQHHRLITDEKGKRFAKRDMSATLKALREKGVTHEEILARLNISDV